MMFKTLKDRVEYYQSISDTKLMPRLPIVIVVNGRSFARLTSLLDKPYCPKLAECLLSTTHRLCTEIEGAVFAYQHNDEILIIARNDQNDQTEMWCNGNLQKMCSLTSAIATMHFNDCASKIELPLTSDPVFTAQVFNVPSIAEVINAVVYRQQHNFQCSIQFACLYDLLKTHDKNSIREMLSGLTIDEKIDLLRQECGTDFHQLPLPFRRGIAYYRVPRAVDGKVKYPWVPNMELPIFTKNTAFLTNIFRHSNDVSAD